MTIYKFEKREPSIGKSSYVHPQATIIGDVRIGDGCFIGAGAVIRGDYGTIVIGNRTSVQENCVIHARENEQTTVGNDVQIGHGSVLHGCTIKDFAVVGMNATIGDHATVGIWAIVGEGALVPSGSVVQDNYVVVGVPAKELRQVTEKDKELWSHYKKKYTELAERYKNGLQRV